MKLRDMNVGSYFEYIPETGTRYLCVYLRSPQGEITGCDQAEVLIMHNDGVEMIYLPLSYSVIPLENVSMKIGCCDPLTK